MPLGLSIEKVSKSFGKSKALDGVSMDIAPGQIVALLGPNGAGKSTLMSCLAGLLEPDSGSIRYDGKPFDAEDIPLRRRLGYLPDTPAVYGNMTVLYYIGLVVRLYGLEEAGLEDRVVELLEHFDLLFLAGQSMEELSRGQIYKTALAAFLTVSPELMILDEPFASGMDPAGLIAFKDGARAAAAKGCTVLYSTQLLEAAEKFADRIYILDKGIIHASGTADELAARSGNLEALFRRLRERG